MCVLFIPHLFVYLRLRISSNPRSIAGVPFDSAGRFRATLLLRTTCMRSCCTWIASCVATSQTKNQKVQTQGLSQSSSTLSPPLVCCFKSLTPIQTVGSLMLEIFCREFSNFQPRIIFFSRKKSPHVACYERWGRLVGWLGFWATFRHAYHGKK